MALPANITTDLTNLSAAYTAASPLSSASANTILALAEQAENVVTDIDVAVLANASGLDNWTAPVFVSQLPATILATLDLAQTQTALADIRGFVGRVASNLAQD